MLRTNSKQVKTALVAHIVKDFLPINYGAGDNALDNLVDQIDAMRFPHDSVYQTGIRYIEGGSRLVYYTDVRKYLQEILEQTDEQSQKYSDDKVWKLYMHLCARTIDQLYFERKQEVTVLTK